MSNRDITRVEKEVVPAEKERQDINKCPTSSLHNIYEKQATIASAIPRNYSERASSNSKQISPGIPFEGEWEDEGIDYSSCSPTYHQPTPPKELHFIETDSAAETRPEDHRRRSGQRVRKTSSEHDTIPSPLLHKQVSPPPPKNPSSGIKSDREVMTYPHPPPANGSSYRHFEMNQPKEHLHTHPANNSDFEPPNQHDRKYSPAVSAGYDTLSYLDSKEHFETNQNTIIPETNRTTPSVDKLSATLKSSLTFGDTRELFEKIQNDYSNNQQSVTDNNYLLDRSIYKPNNEHTVEDTNNTPNPPSYLESLETDIILHNFIKHEPPNPVNTQPQAPYQSDVGNSSVNGLPNSNQFLLNNNEHDSSSSASDTPLQNSSPYGSYEKLMNYGLLGMQPQSNQVPYHILNSQGSVNNLQAMHIPNNLTQLGLHGMPPSYGAPMPVRMPMNPQFAAVQQFLLEHQAQLHYQAQLMAMSNYQYHNSVPQPQVPMHSPQLAGAGVSAFPTQGEIKSSLPNEMEPTGLDQGVPRSTKSREEMLIEYTNAIQNLKKIQGEIAAEMPILDPYSHFRLRQQVAVNPSQMSPQQQYNDPSELQPTMESAVGKGRGRIA